MAGERKAKERTIEREILDALNREPDVFAIKYNPKAGYIPGVGVMRRDKFVVKGGSDIFVFKKPGKFMAIEVKTPEARKLRDSNMSLEQKGFFSKLDRLGFRSHIASSREEALALVRSL